MGKDLFSLSTGYLIVDDYSRGKLETLSIGDYGKEANVVANFLGLSKPVNSVPCKPTRPLQEKWVVTLSTQYGCQVGCKFCDVPKVGFRGNATTDDLWGQFKNAISAFPDVKYTDRLNLHFARMGEPMDNFENVMRFSEGLGSRRASGQLSRLVRADVIHPVFTTCMPAHVSRYEATCNLVSWANMISACYGSGGLQISVNSTDDSQRDDMFNGMSYGLPDIASICKALPEPVGRKYCLNFALHDGTIIDSVKLAKLFSPQRFMVKLTPMHHTSSCTKNGTVLSDGHDSYCAYAEKVVELESAGFDVLVFIPSLDEEEGLITCGNAVLSGSDVKTSSSPMIIGQKGCPHG